MIDLLSELLFFLQRFDALAVIDLLLVTAIFFFIITLVRGTQAVILLRGMIILIIFMTLLTILLPLPAFSWLLQTALPALLVAIPVIFAPEIRRAFERIGRPGSLFSLGPTPDTMSQVVETIVQVSQRLSDRNYGALIAIERDMGLDEYIETGVQMDAALSPELLMQIFFTNTPLHDGAVILRENRMAAAACVFPLSSSGMLTRTPEHTMGLRHRAALGISEVSDAVAIVVSEETGNVSVTHNGRIIRRLDPSRLRNILNAFYRPRTGVTLPGWLSRLLYRLNRSQSEATGD
jgi:diadenylate cyclase